MKRLIIPTFASGLWLALLTTSGASFCLVENSEPKAALVLPDHPTRSAELAALELQAHLKQQTGAELPLIKESEALPAGLKPFFLGATKSAKGLNLQPTEQQALLLVSPERATLFGLDSEEYGDVDYENLGAWKGFKGTFPTADLGTLLGAYEILQRYGGIRWYMPTEIGTHIPKRADFHLPEGRHLFENWTRYRFIGNAHWSQPGDPGKVDLIGLVRTQKPISNRDSSLHALRMRRGGETFTINHSVRDYYARFGKTNPSWWVDNVPAPEKQLKYHHPEVIAQVVADARAFFDRPFAERKAGLPGVYWAGGNYFGVMPTDNRDYGTDCHPPLQPEKAIVGRMGSGTASNYIFTWVNNVAKEVAKTHPDAFISAGAYAAMFEPPDFPLEPNVAVSVSMYDLWKPFAIDILKQWSKQAKRLYTWEYHYAFGRMFPVRPYKIAEYLETLREVNIRGMFMEMGDHNPALYHLDYYLMTQGLLSKDFDVEAALREYYVNFYGPAAKPMEEFWETLFAASARSDAATDPARSWIVADEGDNANRLAQCIENAKSLARNDSLVLERIKIMESGVLAPYRENLAQAKMILSNESPTLAVARTNQPIIIDGKFDEPAWNEAPASSRFVGTSKQPISVGTTVRAILEEDALVIGFECEEPEMSGILTKHLSSSAGICTDDSVEINLRPSSGGTDYLQVMANSAGYTWHWWRGKHNPGEPRDLKVECVAAKLTGKWQLEIRVPLGELKRVSDFPKTFTANFMRNRPRAVDFRTSPEIHTVWSPTFEHSYHTPDRFGKLIFPTLVNRD